MPQTFKSRRRVEWADTDTAGIIHFANYFRYMEEAEHALRRHLGRSVKSQTPEGTMSWPRVAASCNFVKPVRFEDEVEIETRVKEMGGKSVTFLILFTKDGQTIATGELTSVCCIVGPEGLRGIPIPDELRAKFADYMDATT